MLDRLKYRFMKLRQFQLRKSWLTATTVAAGLSLFSLGLAAFAAASLPARSAPASGSVAGSVSDMAFLLAPGSKETGASVAAQAAADLIKTAAGTDGAFLAAGLLKEPYDQKDLSSLLLYPDDQIVVLKLTGAQIRQALERSVSLYPQPNTSFLQLSGFSATFSKEANPGKRILSVSTDAGPLVDTKSYEVAMPSSLGHGGLGYFKIWDTPNITKTLSGVTVESVLKGKPFTASSPRWSAS